MRSTNTNAVMWGVALVFLLDFLLALPLRLILDQNAFGPDTTVTVVLLASLVLGALTCAAGGYLSARLAHRLPYKNAAAVGVINIVVGAFMVDGAFPLWFYLQSFSLMVPAALTGAHLGRGRRARSILQTQ